MKHFALFILTFFYIKGVCQEKDIPREPDKKEDCLFLYTGLGGGGTTRYTTFTWAYSTTYAHKWHSFTMFGTGSHLSDYVGESRDKSLLYKNRTYGLVYGPGYYRKYFSASGGLGICYVNTIQREYHSISNYTPLSAMNSTSTDLGYKGIFVPVLAQVSVHGSAVGFQLQFIDAFTIKQNEWRLTAGLTIGLQ